MSLWKRTLKLGLLGGLIAVYIALTGMPLSLSRRAVIGEFTLGHLTYLIVFAAFGYLRAAQMRKEKQASAPAILAHAAVTGLLSGLLLALLVLLGQRVDLGFIFISAKPQLYRLLTFQQENLTTGLVYLVAAGTVLGLLFALPQFLPEAFHKAALSAVAITLVLGVFSELVQRTILKYALGSFFAYQGLKPMGALWLFVITFALSWVYFALRPYIQVQDKRIQQVLGNQPSPETRLLFTLALLAFLLVMPIVILQKDTYLLSVINLVGLYIIMGLGLNIVVGFAGLLDLGYVAFFAIGAYTVALLTSRGELGRGWDFWAALPLAILFALTAGVLLGIPVLRMRGDYLAIVTLGFGEIIRILANSDWLKPWMGGALGVLEIPKPTLFGYTLKEEYQLYYLILAGILITWLVAHRLYHSRLGRAWQAMREDEDVAEGTGIHLVTTKLLAFGFGAAFSGLSGAIFATKVGSVYPYSFNLLISINVLCLIIVGGMGSLPGVVVGAFALVGLPELLREFSEYRMLFYGVALIAMMLLRPEGFIPKKPTIYPRLLVRGASPVRAEGSKSKQ